MVEQFRIKLSEVRQFLKGDLDSARRHELAKEMREAGLPIQGELVPSKVRQD